MDSFILINLAHCLRTPRYTVCPICGWVGYLAVKWGLVRRFDLVTACHYPEIYPQLKDLRLVYSLNETFYQRGSLLEGIELATGFWSGVLRVCLHVRSLYTEKSELYRCLAFSVIFFCSCFCLFFKLG